ncbi:tyrosine-type recombinase/integrase [Agrobacterium vitis]|uniref:tyrosine-type recombinase/integrase n=1 Tax=Agrobacterium vitis TaxID=373 RepID=UPI0012E8DCD2|nr:tyrosine-type recombinase/integrase [Agrobacterium vitis]MVA36110.1 tyrosine-type recombinase/integrase [Agrobacterium vitis]
METRLRYCLNDPDRKGRDRFYVRWSGRKIRIREPFMDDRGEITKPFMDAYWAALDELRGKAAIKVRAELPREDTWDWLCDQYFRSGKFKSYDPATQRDKRNVLGRFCQGAGKLPYKKFRREDMEASQRKRTAGAGDKLVKVIRALFTWAMDQRPALATFNPAARVRNVNKNTEGFHTWTPEEVDRFRAYWPLGSMPRLAMELMINIGARRSDAHRIGPSNEYIGRDGKRWIRFIAHKGRNAYPTTIDVHLTAELIEALAKTPHGSDAYILSALGKPYANESFGNAFKRWCVEAGLLKCSAHGLRKAGSVLYAESGATAPELMALFGWSNMKTAQIYIAQADKRRMTANAQERLASSKETQSVSISAAKRRDETKGEKSDG